MQITMAVITGLLAGAHTATWGMYKDAPHEGFTWRKYSRSIVVSGLIALVIVAAGFQLASVGDLLILFGLCYVLERGVTEFYKTFLRNEDQSKYFIPMQFAVRGRVVKSHAKRILIGTAVATAAVVLLMGVHALQPSSGRPSLLLFALTGSLGGWFSAFGGAWKDAPIEGFETLKFFRSPFFTTAYALLLSSFTNELTLTALAGLGFTIATLETYKTFFFPSKPRGKFAGKPIHFPNMLVHRKLFVPIYAGIWALIVTGLVQIFLSRA